MTEGSQTATTFTEDELNEFDNITRRAADPLNLTRINARLDLTDFTALHGTAKCDAIKAELVRRGKW
jgi:hypothetical protein